jgi:uncharacterized membrane protein YeiB
MPTPTPVPAHDRVLALDVLRGVAVGGILLANVIVFFGLAFLSREEAAALSHTAADHIAELFERVFIDQKSTRSSHCFSSVSAFVGESVRPKQS